MKKEKIEQLESEEEMSGIDKLIEKLKEVKEKTKNQYEENDKEIREGFEKLYKDSRCILITTDRGTMAVGTKGEIMTSICAMLSNLLEKGQLSKKEIDFMVKTVYETSNVNDKDEFEKIIDEILGD